MMMAQSKRQPKRQPGGLTLVELLVALGVTTVLLSATAVIFNETSNAISTGIQTGKVLARSRTIGDQMERDFKNMIGPASEHPRGFLVIVNQKYDVDPNVPDDPPYLLDKDGRQFSPGSIRSDQIGFIASYPDGHPLHSMVPINQNANNTYRTNRKNTDARIWYGHLSPVAYTPSTGGDLPPEAYEWSLGRQALLLDGDGSRSPRPPRPTWASRRNNALYDWVDRVTLREMTTDTTPTGNNYTPTIRANREDEYLSRMFLGRNRLKVRSQINPPYDAEQVAQMHPHLSDNVSDFIVEFAADLDTDGYIDRRRNGTGQANAPASGSIYWYDASDFGTSGNTTGSGTPATWDSRAITEYSSGSDNSPYIDRLNVTPPYEAFVWQYNDYGDLPNTSGTVEKSAWPRLIRIRYRVHDGSGEVRSSYPPFLTNARDDDGDGNREQWIDTDSDGDYELTGFDRDEATGVAGRWFEHVFRVPRPGS